MAPTGKAADRMNESTGHDTTTFHTGLGRAPEGGSGFFHNADEPFDCEVVISDEWSMVDTKLGDAFTQAIKPGVTRLIMVGDVDQLASVDPGRVLHDVIQSGICPITRFTKVHRTGAGSAIAIGAAAINRGEMPEFGKPGESDLVFVDVREVLRKRFPAEPGGQQDFSPSLIADTTARRIVEMVAERLPAFAKMSPSDIQVLTPGKNSAAGTISLNAALQDALNPSAPMTIGANGPMVSIAGGQKARMGDKVICTRNSRVADKDEELVFNGDVGVVDDLEQGVDRENNPANWLHLQIGTKKRLKLERAYWQNIALAYALTIHKSQGSEYPIVVIPMITSHYKMLKRNLLYTGVTRARKMCVIVGTKDAIRTAIATMDGTTRQTGLLSRIKKFAKLN
jgi:exodeoxyribonuclease V alpha subunit